MFMYTGQGRAALEPKEFTLGFPQLPQGRGAELGSCAMALGTPSTCKSSRESSQGHWSHPSDQRKVPGGACGHVPPAVPSLSVPELLSWTESEWCKLEKLLNSLRLNFPNQEREFKISWYMHTRGEKNPHPDAANPKKSLH